MWELVYVIINLSFLLRGYQTGIASIGRKWLCRKSSNNRLISKGLFFFFSKVFFKVSWLALIIDSPIETVYKFSSLAKWTRCVSALISYSGSAASWPMVHAEGLPLPRGKVGLRISCLLPPVILQEGDSLRNVLLLYGYLSTWRLGRVVWWRVGVLCLTQTRVQVPPLPFISDNFGHITINPWVYFTYKMGQK